METEKIAEEISEVIMTENYQNYDRHSTTDLGSSDNFKQNNYQYMHTHICTHTIHVDIVTNARTYIHINASHTYARVRARTHTHTHTHTHCCTTRGFSVPPTVKGCVEVAQKIPTVSVIVSS